MKTVLYYCLWSDVNSSALSEPHQSCVLLTSLQWEKYVYGLAVTT